MRPGRPILPDELPPIDPVSTTAIALGGEGRMTNSGPLDGLSKSNAIKRIIEQLEKDGTRPCGQATTASATG
jgi:leucyl-tRNA synthetase